MVKNLLAMQKTQVRSSGSIPEDILEKEMTIHSSILAWRIPWAEKLGGLQSMGSQRIGHDQSNLAYTHVSLYGKYTNKSLKISNLTS